MVMTVGGAVAFADPESGSSPAAGATPAGHASTTKGGPLAGVTESLGTTLRNTTTTLRDVTTTVGAGRNPLTQSLAGVTDSVTKSALGAVSSGLTATSRITRTVTGVIEAPQRPLTATVDTVTLNPAEAAPTAVVAVPEVIPVVDTLVSTVDQVASAPASALATVQSVVEPVVTGVGIIPNLTAPIPDVIAALQNLLTATTDAVTQFSALPSDLASLFGVTGTSPTTGSIGTGGPWAASGSPVASPLQMIQLLTGTPAGPTSMIPVPMAPAIDLTAALGLASSASTSARVAPSDVVPGGFEAFLRSAGGLVAIVAVSLSAVAVLAMSGVAGLFASTAAGVRVGYRQAKARMALRASGIARFAVGGPVGVVRTGSLVAFRPRPVKVTRPSMRSLAADVA
jgi:hypothetical protein